MKRAIDKPHIHVTAGIIRRDGRVLITRRPWGRHLGGLWEFPGGKQEENESLEQCLVREIQEELGMAVHPDQRVLQVDHEYDDRRVTLYFYSCTPLTGEEPRGLEGQETRWVRPEDLSLFRFPPPDNRMIRHLQDRGKMP